MTPVRFGHPRLRRLVQTLALASSMLLVVGTVLVGLHQHDERSSTPHACAICSLGHTPAVTTVFVVGSVPTPRLERVTVEPTLAPRTQVVLAAASRAPPSA